MALSTERSTFGGLLTTNAPAAAPARHMNAHGCSSDKMWPPPRTKLPKTQMATTTHPMMISIASQPFFLRTCIISPSTRSASVGVG